MSDHNTLRGIFNFRIPFRNRQRQQRLAPPRPPEVSAPMLVPNPPQRPGMSADVTTFLQHNTHQAQEVQPNLPNPTNQLRPAPFSIGQPFTFELPEEYTTTASREFRWSTGTFTKPLARSAEDDDSVSVRSKRTTSTRETEDESNETNKGSSQDIRLLSWRHKPISELDNIFNGGINYVKVTIANKQRAIESGYKYGWSNLKPQLNPIHLELEDLTKLLTYSKYRRGKGKAAINTREKSLNHIKEEFLNLKRNIFKQIVASWEQVSWSQFEACIEDEFINYEKKKSKPE